MKFAHLQTSVQAALIAAMLTAAGCATVGAKLAYRNGLEEEARGCQESYSPAARVELAACERISRLIQRSGLKDGYVGYDAAGKIRLKGAYETEEDVDRAFTIAQTVVGAQGTAISDITPRHIGLIKMVRQPDVTVDPAAVKGKKYALLIGVSRFKYGFPPIPAAEKDVADFASTLKRQGYQRVVTLTNEQATRRRILEEFRALVANATPDSRVFLYFSTHGTPPDKFGKLGIVPYDLGEDIADLKELNRLAADTANAGDEEILKVADLRYRAMKTAITQDDLNAFLGDLRSGAGRTVTVIDTCYSGAALGAFSRPLGGAQYAEREAAYTYGVPPNQIAELAGDGNRKDLVVADQADASPVNRSQVGGTGGIPDYDYRQLPVPAPEKDASRHRGSVVMAAATGHEPSRFDGEGRTPIRNSFFTYYFLNGLKQLHGQTGKAFEYASVRTQRLVSDLTANAHTQTPQMYSAPEEKLNIDLFQ